ncbi:uncharacterized protein [Primulina eburnea]|uniref:uncharacterized protein n=1 Tax=Primulina eburnea TaxID=1245227 RepID=UPI003C6BDEB8
MLSPSYGFCPEDDELIVDYLNKKIDKEDAPYNRIPKVNVYNHTPEELAELHQSLRKDEWYFYSSRDRKYLNGNRPNRAAGNGFWKATGADKKIYRDGKSVGSKKCLVFYQGKPQQSNKTTWIMHEYVADRPQRRRLPNGNGDMRLDDCVLCRIYKKSEYSPKEEKGAAASESGETAKRTAPKSSENKKRAAPRRVKTKHEGTNQQHNLPVLQMNLQMQQQNLPVIQPNIQTQQQNLPVIQPSLPTQQQNLQVLQPNLSMSERNQHAMQNSLQRWSYNLGGRLDFPMERNSEDAQPIMLQPNVPTPHQNPQAIMQNSLLQPWSCNLGRQFDFRPESNQEEAQPIIQQPNLPTPQQNLRAIMQNSLLQPWSCNLGRQFDLRPESNQEEAQPIIQQPNLPTPQQNLRATHQDLGGQLDFPMESIPEEVNQFHFVNLGNGHETVGNSIPMDTFGNLTYPPLFHNGFRYKDLYPLSSLDSFDPIPTSLYNNDHPQNGSLIQGDELVFPKAATSDKAYNPREKS